MEQNIEGQYQDTEPYEGNDKRTNLLCSRRLIYHNRTDILNHFNYYLAVMGSALMPPAPCLPHQPSSFHLSFLNTYHFFISWKQNRHILHPCTFLVTSPNHFHFSLSSPTWYLFQSLSFCSFSCLYCSWLLIPHSSGITFNVPTSPEFLLYFTPSFGSLYQPTYSHQPQCLIKAYTDTSSSQSLTLLLTLSY